MASQNSPTSASVADQDIHTVIPKAQSTATDPAWSGDRFIVSSVTPPEPINVDTRHDQRDTVPDNVPKKSGQSAEEGKYFPWRCSVFHFQCSYGCTGRMLSQF